MQARLSEAEDVPVVGISRMFYKVYAEALLANADAMFWYEHDVYAIRPHWIDALHREALVAGRFWVRGSVTRTASLDASIACKTEVPREIPAGDAPPISTLLWESHINGAALFSLRDPAFASAVAAANRSFPEAAYDVAIHAVVADHRRHSRRSRARPPAAVLGSGAGAPEDYLAFDRPSPGLDRFPPITRAPTSCGVAMALEAAPERAAQAQPDGVHAQQQRDSVAGAAPRPRAVDGGPPLAALGRALADALSARARED